MDVGPVQLRLGFNSGVAFALGAALPAGVVLAGTGLVVVALVLFAWRSARAAILPTLLCLAVIVGGAVANLIDRARDGVVTDYLHTGWFPTFNLADVFLTAGVAALVLISLSETRDPAKDPAS